MSSGLPLRVWDPAWARGDGSTALCLCTCSSCPATPSFRLFPRTVAGTGRLEKKGPRWKWPGLSYLDYWWLPLWQTLKSWLSLVGHICRFFKNRALFGQLCTVPFSDVDHLSDSTLTLVPHLLSSTQHTHSHSPPGTPHSSWQPTWGGSGLQRQPRDLRELTHL